jgi:quercetin dioxygenase-like cupin family protein
MPLRRKEEHLHTHQPVTRLVLVPFQFAQRRKPMLAERSKTAFPDPTLVAGDVYNKVMENDRARVFDVHFKPGQKAVMHGHPDHIVYVLSDYTLNLTAPDGSSQVVPLKAGQAFWMEAGPHAAQNIGKTEGHALVIELKESPKMR